MAHQWHWTFVMIVSCLVDVLQAQTDYCANSNCRNGRPNVGCNPPASPGGPACAGLNPEVKTFSPEEQTLILSEHNKRRSQLAQGELKPFQPAVRMPTLTWDEELAKQAGNNARSCTYQHDSCRNTPVFAWAGQNLALSQSSGMNKTVSEVISSSIASWWSEHNVTREEQLNTYPSSYSGPAIGHFTQMASDQSDKIGCAMQNWVSDNWQTYYFVCNYGVTNIADRPVYKAGAVASKCTTGRNPTLPGLCSETETINPVPNEPKEPK
ncbi:AGAP006418-PA [Anopheles gambiae str. PEST]|uniref:Venom allergen-1 n=1 Tax=Anopheles gambiae TaxID=7165 RepID=Q7Q5I3_ANOGA|nr:AGAP006418-PA [Anopheles gambiae str. PEST]